jgi:hypothetical protein
MNRQQGLALQIAAVNLALLLLFPPYDHVSLQRGDIPTFDGFFWAFAEHGHGIVNRGFLELEIIVLCINAAIAWLLLNRAPASRHLGASPSQRTVLLLLAINLVLILLFPPFEYQYAIGRNQLPTFDGFYFVFSDNAQRQIVTPVLYIEIALLLVNSGLLWLLFEERSARPRYKPPMTSP